MRVSTVFVMMALTWVGCGAPPKSSDGGSKLNAGAMGPLSVTMTRDIAATDPEGLRLSDGAPLTQEWDLMLEIKMLLSLASPTVGSICAKGKFNSLAEVPTDVGSCPAGPRADWTNRLTLSPAAMHTAAESSVVGLGALVRNGAHDALYRIRVVADTYQSGTATATFEYEPVE